MVDGVRHTKRDSGVKRSPAGAGRWWAAWSARSVPSSPGIPSPSAVCTSVVRTTLLVGLTLSAAPSAVEAAPASANSTHSLKNFSAALELSQTAEKKSPTQHAPMPGEIVTARDAFRGVPTFLRAAPGQVRAPEYARKTPEAAALWYLRAHADLYQLSEQALHTVSIHHRHTFGNGSVIVELRQEHGAREILRQALKILMNSRLELIGISGNLRAEATTRIQQSRSSWNLNPEDAIVRAFENLHQIPIEASDLLETDSLAGESRFYDLLPGSEAEGYGVAFAGPARVKEVYFPLGDVLVPAYYVEVSSGSEWSTDSLYYAYVVAADDGRLLLRENLTADVAFNYKVWAESTGDKRPLNGPLEDFAPHPTGELDGSRPGYIAPLMVSMDGFNKNPQGQLDPWLASNATYTFGNNVIAYADHYLPDGYTPGDTRATTTKSRTFDRTYDVTKEPTASTDQVMAAVTDLFYTTNWLHDWYYDSGFTEAAGNAQEDNYGRGGVEADPLRAEGQDSALSYERNNANMATPADGVSPRMQMYLWTGDTDVSVDVPVLGRTLDASYAVFGPRNFSTTGTLILVNDGTSTVTDACETIRTNLARRIAVVDRGNCDFITKAQNVQNAGAIGMVVVNNVEGDPINMAASTNVSINIPCVGISLADGTEVKTAMKAGSVSVTLNRVSDVERDGTIDNTVVAHEWGHYLHKRLVTTCVTNQCRAQSEGWADFVAVHMMLEPTDSLEGTYAMALYAVNSESAVNSAYYGLRRAPYSTNFAKNALSFRHIQDDEPLPLETEMLDFGNNAEVHNAGEIWTTMLWEIYAGLQNQTRSSQPRYTYEEARRRMSDYVVAGMMLAPADPTFTEQRDGVLAAVAAADPIDFDLVAQAFARRGAGTCAVSPPRDSTDFKGVVESFELKPDMEYVIASIEESGSCDADGNIDAYEEGVLTVEILNKGTKPLVGAIATLSSSNPGVSFPEGASATVSDAQPFGKGSASITIRLDGSFEDISALDFTVDVVSDAACGPLVGASSFRVNYDEQIAASRTDDFESDVLGWSIFQPDPSQPSAWERVEDDVLHHHMHGNDLATLSDTSLVTPLIKASDTEPFTFAFRHRHKFETGPAEEGAPDSYWDGAVIEISTDSGKTWADVNTYIDPGYNGIITTEAGNTLGGRDAFVSTNPSYPEFDTLTLDFGTRLLSKDVQLRLRVASDEAVGDEGWEIDDVVVTGSANTPFNRIGVDETAPATFYSDVDGDDFGNASGDTVLACVAREGFSSDASDCDDADATTNPEAPELCDELDNDCNGQVDDQVIAGQTVYLDADGDTYGDESQSMTACDVPEGYVTEAGDCDDADDTLNPSQVEICDQQDNDCDGLVDNEAEGAQVWFIDQDGDGYGSILTTEQACDQPDGYVAQAGDCNDLDSTIYFGAPEPADGVDHDCDGLTTTDPTPTATPTESTPTQAPEVTPTEAPTTPPDADTPTASPTEAPDPATETPEGTGTPEPGAEGCSCSQPGQESSKTPMAPALLALGLGLMALRRRNRN